MNINDFREMWKSYSYNTEKELQKSLENVTNFTYLFHDICKAVEMQILQDLYQEYRKNIDKNIKKVGVKIAKTKIHK